MEQMSLVWFGDLFWLVVGPPQPEKYEFVNWDDDIPNFCGKKNKNGNQATNQS